MYLNERSRTGIYASAAACTLVCMKHQFRSAVIGFRVMAPYTTQWTALSENGCPNPRAIVYGVTFDIEDSHAMQK